MVDYFALIAPTIESLAKSTVEERRQVYDRLIKMLEAQLRTAEPPRSEIDILRERIDLEAAIRRVERRIQAGQIAVGKPITPDVLRPVDEQMAASTAPIPEPPKVKLPSPPEPQAPVSQPQAPQTPQAAPQPAPIAPEIEPPAPETAEPSPVPAASALPLPPTLTPMPPRGAPSGEPQAPRPVDRPPNFPPRGGPRPPQPFPPSASGAMSPESRSSIPPRRPLPPSDLPPGPPRRAPQDMAQTLAPPFRQPLPPRPPVGAPVEPDAGRPIFGPREGDGRVAPSRSGELPSSFRSMPGALSSQPAPRRAVEPERRLPPLPPLPSSYSAAAEQAAARAEAAQNDAAFQDDYVDTQRDDDMRDRTRSARESNIDPVSTSGNSETARPTVSINLRGRSSMLPFRGPGGWKRMGIITACIAAILSGIALTAFMLRDDPAEFKNATGKYAATEKPQAEEKIADRLAPQAPAAPAQKVPSNGQQSNSAQSNSQQQGNAPQSGPSAPTPDANGVLTQKAMLVMEPSDQSSPAPTLNGRVVWKLETLKSVVDNASEIGSRATIEIAEVGLNATIIFRRNRDPQSANSHMIEVNFTLADNNSTGKVRDIRVPELRSDENARGTSLSGVPVPVTENVFLVGLNALPSEMQKNLDLLRAQNWFAMPLRFANGKRGILMFEKGKTGERVMEDAMQAWKAN